MPLGFVTQENVPLSTPRGMSMVREKERVKGFLIEPLTENLKRSTESLREPRIEPNTVFCELSTASRTPGTVSIGVPPVPPAAAAPPVEAPPVAAPPVAPPMPASTAVVALPPVFTVLPVPPPVDALPPLFEAPPAVPPDAVRVSDEPQANREVTRKKAMGVFKAS